MNIIKTPDKIVLDRIAIEKILREHIHKTTGRISRANVCFTELPAVNGFSNFQLTIELTDDAPVKETPKTQTLEELVREMTKQGQRKNPFEPLPKWPGMPPFYHPDHTYRSPGVVPSPWPWPTTHYVGMDKAWDLS